MSRWADWIRTALRPNRRELEAIAEPLPPELLAMAIDATTPDAKETEGLQHPVPADVLNFARAVTEPTEAEVLHLLRSRPEHRRSPTRLWPISAMAFAAAAAVALWITRPTGYGAPDVGVGQVAEVVTTTPLSFGPSISVVGEAELAVLQADETGTVLDLDAGFANFEVDPTGAYRSLRVLAEDVVVEVTGTQFRVEVADGGVEVRVSRGSVRIQHDGQTLSLPAPGTWSSIDAVAVVQAQTVPEPQAIPEPEVVPDRSPPAPDDAVVVVSPKQPIAAPPPVPTAELTPATRAPSANQAAIAAMRDIEEARLGFGDVEPLLLLVDIEEWLDTYGGIDQLLRAKAEFYRIETMAKVYPEKSFRQADLLLVSHPKHVFRRAIREVQADAAYTALDDCGLAVAPLREVSTTVMPLSRRAQINYALGICEEKLGRWNTAETALKEALRLGLPPDLETDARRRIIR